MNDVIYIRTSTEDQNPENQLKDIYSMADIQDAVIYKDQQSAWKDTVERDNFNIIINKIKAREIKDLWIWDWDRLYRNRLKLIAFLKLCKAYKCKVHSYRQKFMENIHTIPVPFNEIVEDMMIQLLGWLAEEESQKKSERIKAATRSKNGKTISYKGNKWGRKALPKQTKDRVITLYEEGNSMRTIASMVKTTDKNKNQKNISVGAVHKIVSEYIESKGSLS